MSPEPAAPAAAGAAGNRGWSRALGAAAAVVLGAVFLVATWGKALDPAAFAGAIRTQGLDFLLPASAVALLALGLEAGLGTALVLAVRRLWVLVPTALLVAFFLYLTGHDYWLAAHGRLAPDAGCGCFGNLVERTPAEAFWQDLGLLGVPLVLAYFGRGGRGGRGGPRRFPAARAAVAAVAAVGAMAFAWKAPDLPLDDLATRLAPGVEVADLCAGGSADADGAGGNDSRICLTTVVPELTAGRNLVVIADLDDPSFGDAVDRLNAYAFVAREGGAPPLWVVWGGTLEQQRTFFWRFGPVFEVREAPPALLRPLYRRLPRSFMVEDGMVRATYSGLPPLATTATADGGRSLASSSASETAD